MKAETVIWGLPKGETRDYMETVLYDGGLLLNESQVQQIKDAATKDGFHSFRVWKFEHGQLVDFSQTINS